MLPSLLLSLNKHIMSKAFQEPLLEIMDEGEDIELMELKLDRPTPQPNPPPGGLGAPEGDEMDER